MVQKSENGRNSKLASVLVFLITLYVGFLLLQLISPITSFGQAIIINCFMVLTAALVVILTIIFVAQDKHKWPVSLIVFFILFIGSMFAPLTSPYSKYPVYIVKCGGQPIVATNFAAAHSYSIPSDKRYGINPFVEYYCTTQEAQAAGFHHR
jgi:predicted neutral ceramidase superfamily lipid hydrolase